jgi:hypothetical protein
VFFPEGEQKRVVERCRYHGIVAKNRGKRLPGAFMEGRAVIVAY